MDGRKRRLVVAERAAVPEHERPWPHYARLGPIPTLAFFLVMGWTFVLWAAALVKIADSSFTEYIQFFTNWSWTIQLLFFTADLLCYMDTSGRCHRILTGHPFWLVYSITWTVFWLVFLLLANNPDIFNDVAEEGDLSMSTVLLGDRLVHVLPPIAMSAFMWHRWHGITHHVWWIRHTEVYSVVTVVLQVLLDVYLAPLLFSALYAAGYDPRAVYDVDPWVLAAGIGLTPLVLSLFSGVPYAVASRHTYHYDTHHLHPEAAYRPYKAAKHYARYDESEHS